MPLTRVNIAMIDGGPVNVLAYGADPSGATDSTSAINAAIATGNTVFFPDGTYLVTTLTLQDDTHLVGASWNAIIKSDTTDVISLLNTSGCTFDTLCFDHTDGTNNYFFVLTNGADNTTINNCKFVNCNIPIYGSSSVSIHPKHIVITNNLFEECVAPIYAYVGSYWSIQNNKCVAGLTVLMQRGITLSGFRNCIVSGNEIYGDGTNTVTGILFLYNQTNNAYFNSCFNTVTNNTITGITEESLSFDQSNSIFIDGGTATSGANTALTDSTKSWTTNAYANYYLVIVSGTAVGQYQKIVSNTSTTLTVDGRWTANPDATSVYIITPAFIGNTVANNTIKNYTRNGIVLYGPCLANIVDGNTINDGCTDTASTDILSAIEVWGVHRGATGNPANDRQPAFHNVITNNSINNTTAQTASVLRPAIIVYTHDAQGGGTVNWQVLGNIVKGNTIGSNVNPGIYLHRATKNVVIDNTSTTRSGVVYLSGTNETDNRIEGNIVFSAAGYRVGATSYATTSHGTRTGTSDPVTAVIVPFYVGEEFYESSLTKWYKSIGLTAADWVALN